jgi:hypothetical protein
MKSKILTSLFALSVVGSNLLAGNWTEGMKDGTPAFKSMGPLAFGPDAVLFVADTKSAAIFAIALDDKKASATGKPLKIEAINQKVAALLGTSADQILIDDMVVNPVSRNVYLAISRGRGPDAAPVLVRTTPTGDLEVVSLEKVKFAKAELPDAPVDGVVGPGNRQSNPRRESITDIAFLENRLLVAGLSNEEFASSLRAIPFPFKAVANGTSVEIYHGAHGKFETRSPVRTFVPFKVGNEPHLLAAYTCTPLVQFPLSDLKPGAKVKGKTIAELGNRNRPLDMIVYEKGGKDYLLLANNSRGIMKISTDKIENAEGIETPVTGGGKKGLEYETVADWKGVDQLDRYDTGHAVVVRRADGGSLNLEALPLP